MLAPTMVPDSSRLDRHLREMAASKIDVRCIAQSGVFEVRAGQRHLLHDLADWRLAERGFLSRRILNQLLVIRYLGRVRRSKLIVMSPECLPIVLFCNLVFGTPFLFDSSEDYSKRLQIRRFDHSLYVKPIDSILNYVLSVCAKRATALVSANPGTFADLDRAFHVPNISSYAVSLQLLKSASDAGSLVNNMDSKEIRLGYLGSISSSRFASEMVAAVKKVGAETESRVVLDMVGRDPDGLVDKAIVAHDVRGRIVHHGFVGLSDALPLAYNWHLGLALCRGLGDYANSIPVKLYNYCALGVPFLASDFPLWRETFGGYKLGYWIDPEDLDSEGLGFEIVRILSFGWRRLGWTLEHVASLWDHKASEKGHLTIVDVLHVSGWV